MRKLLVVAVAALSISSAVASAAPPSAHVRFANFNASLNRSAAGQLLAHLSSPEIDDVFRRQIRNDAEVVQRVRPDVLLVNEFDPLQDGDVGVSPGPENLFRSNYLEIGQMGAAPIDYDYTFIAASNTGVFSGKDLNGDGVVGTMPGTAAYANDAHGFGFFPGQFGMVVYSKYPIAYDRVRTFRKFLWKDMPGNLIPTGFYSPDEVDILRLSSKSHWDVPIQIGRKTVHFLVSHPTPPVFDGPEDRNGRRNHDEIRFWADYITPGKSGYIYDDEGQRGGLKPGALFVIAGDQNSDPLDGDSVPGAIQKLLEHPLVNTKLTPESAGAVEAARLQGRASASHKSDPRFDTADFSDTAPGNLRADYVLPRKSLRLVDAGVFWPLRADPLFRLTGVVDFPTWGAVGGFPTSDHRSVWIDVAVPSVK
ncbi:MAG: endonuclease/exonuclease/phosphatase family protein [Gaiellaceae bacterium]